MSIANEITRIQGAKDSLKSSIEAKGVSVPSNALIDEYPALVDAIPQGGGGGGVPEKDVNFYDYDGTCVYSYTKSEFLALSALPANPDHSDRGFVNDGWNWDLPSAKSYVQDFGGCHIGQMYHLNNNVKLLAEVELISDSCTLTLYSLKTSVSAGATIDWGDGTSTQTAASTGAVNYSHTYSGVSKPTIKIICSNGTVTFDSTNSAACLFGQYTDLKIKKINKLIVSGLLTSTARIAPKSLRIYGSTENGNSTVIAVDEVFVLSTMNNSDIIDPEVLISRTGTTYAGATAQPKVVALSKDTTTLPTFKGGTIKVAYLPRTITAIGNNVFTQCGNLQKVITPNITQIGNNTFQWCRSLSEFSFPEGLTKLGTNAFQGTPLKDVVLPSTVTALSSAFTNAFIKTLTCKATAPPTVNASSLGNAPEHIYVPAASVDTYKTATNWSTYASIIEAIPTT